MTKSFEELESMEVGQLKGILNGLGVDIPDLDYRKGENKTKLVQLVYDVQQPEEETPEGEDAEEEAEAEDNPEADIDVEALLDEVADFFGGTIDIVGETDDEVTVFAVKSESGNTIEEGTFQALRDKMLTIQRQEAENAAAQLSPEQPEENAEPAPVASEEVISEVEERLKPLKSLGLKAEIGQDVVKLRFGGKAVTTTVHQPVHRIVKTAETLIKIK